MKKQIFQLSLVASLGLPTLALAQNTFPANGNVSIGSNQPSHSVIQKQFSSAHAMGNVPSSLAFTLFDGAAAGMKINSFRDGSLNSQSLEFLTHHGGSSYGSRMVIDKDGRVGIGTTTPDGKLEIKGLSDTPLVRYTAQYITTEHEEEHMDLVPRNANCAPACGTSWTFRPRYWNGAGYTDVDALTIYPSGNVGIGTTTPRAKLDVAGKINCTVLELTSDRHQKQDISPISVAEVLTKVAALPVTTWAYTNSPSVRHLGPMAQDFKAAFSLGEDDKHIGAGDGIGVALAAIKGLHDVVEEKNARIVALETKLANLESRLNASVAVIEKLSEHFPEKPSNLRVSAALQ